ncbi:leukocyte cell-derived chemotaxin-2-like [Pelmatolapia mariae]|uniref:leukocyte cell-derived chemotaxin-2-like n=1 Tax=Pelmatolapia mariae TaxID=158779 RepID=UPI002FE6AA15
MCDAVMFGQLCSGNVCNTQRIIDKWGKGHYGASRCEAAAHSWMSAGGVGRLHKGVDIKCSDGLEVLARFDVTIEGSLIVYNDPNKKAIDEGITLSGEGQSTAHLVTDCVIDPGFDLMTEWLCLCPAGLCFKLFYVKPIKTSGTVVKGEKIGTMLPMQSVYPGITSHIHVQMCNRSLDPTEYLPNLCLDKSEEWLYRQDYLRRYYG